MFEEDLSRKNSNQEEEIIIKKNSKEEEHLNIKIYDQYKVKYLNYS